METIPFTVTTGGKEYRCERVVTGSRTLSQVIRVHGIDSKSDPARYGQNHHPLSTMDTTAMLIAHEIIGQGWAQKT
jgi:hypothetical protein